MSHVENIGTRVELTAMDPHFHEITIGLYEQRDDGGEPAFLVHTYSTHDGAQARVSAVRNAMKVLGGMETSPLGEPLLRFHCGGEHLLACRRVFIEACKLDPDAALAARPLWIHDKKSQGRVTAVPCGSGEYSLEPEAAESSRRRRAAVTAKGLVKLAGMTPARDDEFRVAFDCAHPHDALVGLMLGRALNVRAAVRETEALAGRGALAAPSAQIS